jgi:hypothetical protein
MQCNILQRGTFQITGMFLISEFHVPLLIQKFFSWEARVWRLQAWTSLYGEEARLFLSTRRNVVSQTGLSPVRLYHIARKFMLLYSSVIGLLNGIQ